jgi:hypothetical protein
MRKSNWHMFLTLFDREVASFGEKDDTSFGTPLILTDDLALSIPGNIASLLQPKLGGSTESDDASNDDFGLEGEDDPLHVKEPRITDPSTDALARKSPINGELYEMILAALRRLDALEDATLRIQQHLETLENSRRRQSRYLAILLKSAASLGGVTLLYIIIRAVVAKSRRQ